MSVIKQIRDGILNRMSTVLGGQYSKLDHVTDISKNSFKGNYKKYGVHVGPASEVDGTLGSYTMDHSFSLYLVDSYVNPKNSLNDDAKAELAITLGDLARGVYDDIVKNKSTLSTSGRVIIVNELSINRIEYIDGYAGVLEFDINVRYRSI